MFARTLDDAQRLGDPSLLGLLLAADFALKAFAGELVPSLAVIPEARRHADRSGDPGLRGTVMWCEAFANTWMNPEAGFRALSALEELSAFDTSLGLTVWAYSLHDVARLGRALLCLETGRLLEAGGALDEAFELLSRRPAAEVESWALSASAILADRIGETARADAVRGAAGRGLTRGIESGSIPSAVRASLGLGLAALLAEEADHAVAAFEEGLSTARKRRRGLLDEPRLLASLARAHLLGGDPTTSRACADEALAVARNQRTPLGECQAQWVRALVFRQTATDDADRAVARAAALAAQELVVVSGATIYTPFLAEELARLEGDESALHAAADGYAAIGASGHARRLRDELGLPNLTNRR